MKTVSAINRRTIRYILNSQCIFGCIEIGAFLEDWRPNGYSFLRDAIEKDYVTVVKCNILRVTEKGLSAIEEK